MATDASIIPKIQPNLVDMTIVIEPGNSETGCDSHEQIQRQEDADLNLLASLHTGIPKKTDRKRYDHHVYSNIQNNSENRKTKRPSKVPRLDTDNSFFKVG